MPRLLSAASALVASLVTSPTAAQQKVIVVTWRGCEEACQSFPDYLKDTAPAGEFILRDAGRDKNLLPGFLAGARTEQADLIVTWGTSVTRGIAGTLADLGNPAFNHDIPQVFVIVADRVGAGVIESLERTGRPDLAGTYSRGPARHLNSPAGAETPAARAASG